MSGFVTCRCYVFEYWYLGDITNWNVLSELFTTTLQTTYHHFSHFPLKLYVVFHKAVNDSKRHFISENGEERQPKTNLNNFLETTMQFKILPEMHNQNKNDKRGFNYRKTTKSYYSTFLSIKINSHSVILCTSETKWIFLRHL